jgi:cytochrome c
MATHSRAITAALVFALITAAARAEGPHLGKPISEADIAAWDISILPDGAGLPPGSGTPAQGAVVFAEKCALCHGDNGKGGFSIALTGGGAITDISAGMKTIPNFWPYSTTLFDFIRRAMPWQMPKTLSNDEVYATTAYILALNKLIGETEVMNAETLPKVRMPNRNNFIVRFPERM